MTKISIFLRVKKGEIYALYSKRLFYGKHSNKI